MSDKLDIQQIKVNYFIDYWTDLTNENNSIENELAHSILYNPKELFKEFVEEIERKNLSNNDNKKFFIDKTNEFANLKLDSLNFIKPNLQLIRQQFSKKDDYSYLLHLLNMLLLKLESFQLAEEAINELSIHLTDENKINTEKIKHLVNIIIFELMHKKYSFKTIAKIVDNIFSTYQELSNGVLHTNFPHKIECNNWNVNSEDFKSHQSDLKNHIESLTLEDRLLSLKNYFEKKPIEVRFVFQIKGLKGDNVNITIGNVQIYNPKTIRLFKNPTEHFNELFEREIKHNIYYCNGAVRLNVIDNEYAKQEAITTLEDTINLIASRYTDYKTPINVNKMRYYIIDNDGNERGSGLGSDWEFSKYRNSIELDNNTYKSSIYSKIISKDKILKLDKKIIESIHWKRKAIEANENNEKILWHWVALENIFERYNHSTPKTIFETIPKLLAQKSIYEFAWKHFYLLENKILNRKINLKSELKDNIGLTTKEGDTIYLKNFIDNIDNICLELESNSLFEQQLKYLKLIFGNKQECIKLVEKFELIFFEKLVYVYRLRNKIVHNAYNETNPVSQYYVEFITLISAVSINSFIEKRADFSLETSDEIVNNIIYDYDIFKLELKEKGTGILL